MCNLYHMSPKGDVERYIGRQARLALPDYQATHVQPFDTGLFIRPGAEGELQGVMGQWGMIRPGQKARIEMKKVPSSRPGAEPLLRPMLKNNSRSETTHSSPAFRDAWKQGRRCLIPATWLQEPNWETGRCVWWRLQRADGLPWMVAGIWSEWVDPESGELVPNYAMLTFNVDSHPLLRRLHRPVLDPATKKPLPPDQQDKRGEAHIEPADWDSWLHGDEAAARRLLVPPPVEMFDQAQAQAMDRELESMMGSGDDIGQDELF
ncbi:SOS response-associated peptidase [Roseateles cavernae]|uniref:SOS response-associated peptidase n=1 Tax=Roseateles cavernae TaxID=3153578 RepID=UPI0032E3D182